MINGKEWFKEARPWKPTDVGDERISWIFYYGIPFQAWKPEFFVTLVKSIGKYLCLDDAVRLHTKFDVTRLLLKTNQSKILYEFLDFKINFLLLK